MVRDGFLSRLDLAFCRDQADRVYVQHKMLDYGADVWRWLDDGGHFYVCGDATRMAKDVDAALTTIIEKHGGMSHEQAHDYKRELVADETLCPRRVLEIGFHRGGDFGCLVMLFGKQTGDDAATVGLGAVLAQLRLALDAGDRDLQPDDASELSIDVLLRARRWAATVRHARPRASRSSRVTTSRSQSRSSCTRTVPERWTAL